MKKFVAMVQNLNKGFSIDAVLDFILDYANINMYFVSKDKNYVRILLFYNHYPFFKYFIIFRCFIEFIERLELSLPKMNQASMRARFGENVVISRSESYSVLTLNECIADLNDDNLDRIRAIKVSYNLLMKIIIKILNSF